MTNSDTAAADRNFQKNAMASFVQIGALVVLIVWCFQIIAPFISVILWGMLIAVALYPVHSLLTAKFGGREKQSATVFVILGLAILLVPAYMTADSSAAALRTVGEQLHSGTVSISPPDESVAEWPLIGEKVYGIWSAAASNLEATLNEYSDQLQSLGRSVVSFAGSMAIGILQFVISIIIAGVFLVGAKAGHKTAVKFATSLAGNRGESLIDSRRCDHSQRCQRRSRGRDHPGLFVRHRTGRDRSAGARYLGLCGADPGNHTVAAVHRTRADRGLGVLCC